MLFRTGVRRNNSDVIMAGRLKFSPLFYILRMTFYQEIDFRDIKTRVLMPDVVKQWWNINESFSVSGVDTKGEGGDFILEARNRETKQWMPAGIPDEKRWKRCIRNLDTLKEV